MKLKYWPAVTNEAVADIMSFMTQRSSLINTSQLGKILVLILMILAHYNETTQRLSKIVKDYEMIQGAQLSNSFILLMILNEAKEPLTTTQISELISKRSKGQIYKISATLRDSSKRRVMLKVLR
jgi:hypothetical protein